MVLCIATTKNGTNCTREGKFNGYCGQHAKMHLGLVSAKRADVAGGRQIGNMMLFTTLDPTTWEAEYQRIMDPKYKKGARNYHIKLTGMPWSQPGNPPIYLVPRSRGSSYKDIALSGVRQEDVLFCPISKGFSMGDVSSFTLGPIPGQGLCLVNSAFKCCINIKHIEGGGILDLKRKNFWRASRHPVRQIVMVNEHEMSVDGIIVNIHMWLRTNEHLWLPQWDIWSKSIALSSLGDFHWTDGSDIIGYRYNEQYLTFLQWKKYCYIGPSYELLPHTKVFQDLMNVWTVQRQVLALVHPEAHHEHPELPVTPEMIRMSFNSEYEMTTQPFVLCGLLMGIGIEF